MITLFKTGKKEIGVCATLGHSDVGLLSTKAHDLEGNSTYAFIMHKIVPGEERETPSNTADLDSPIVICFEGEDPRVPLEIVIATLQALKIRIDEDREKEASNSSGDSSIG